MILFLIFYIIYMVYRSMESMHMLQQNLYNENNRYLKWVKKNLKRAFSIIDFVPIILFLLVYVIEDKHILDLVLIGSMFIYIFGIIIEYRRNQSNQNKLPLKATGRIKRLFTAHILIYGIAIYFTVTATNQNIVPLFLILLSVLLGFVYYVVEVANLLNAPINKLVYLHYFRKAKNKLKSYADLSVVGVTGSYGKTSSKNILNAILSNKYITRPTPKNFNTPYGLMITINNYMDKFDQILIAEMGAYVRGEIKGLCDFVKPKYGILTIIGEAHMATFGSQENIQKAKFELIESLPSDGIAILNMDDPLQVSYPLKNKVKVKWIAIENDKADVYAKNVKCTKDGMEFDCYYAGGNVHLKTRLLGSYNIYNIIAAIALGLELGVNINDIKSSVAALKSTEHRLELKKVGDIYMLDDAYNSNPVGASGALDVLKSMPGTRVVVTPGMIELGELEDKKNYEFGVKMASCADYVILIGEKKTKVIHDALIDNKFEKDSIFVLNNVSEAFDVINALKEEGVDIYALFENDLPDIYMEGKK